MPVAISAGVPITGGAGGARRLSAASPPWYASWAAARASARVAFERSIACWNVSVEYAAMAALTGSGADPPTANLSERAPAKKQKAFDQN